MSAVSDVRKQYQDKLITADQAAAKIENNLEYISVPDLAQSLI